MQSKLMKNFSNFLLFTVPFFLPCVQLPSPLMKNQEEDVCELPLIIKFKATDFFPECMENFLFRWLIICSFMYVYQMEIF